MIYRLDAIDASEPTLVKPIVVAAATVQGGNNKPYVRVVSVSNKRGVISAKVELDMETPAGVHRQEVTVQDGDDLEQTSRRAMYADYRIGEIKTTKGEEFVELRYPGGEKYLRIGEEHGDVEPLAIQLEMIHRTINELLEKEKRLRPQGHHDLSLVVIDLGAS